MIVILGDLIADFNLRIPSFPVQAGDITRADYLGLGPGGAANVAITGARLGLEVAYLAEIGDDRFGRIILEGLAREGVDTSGVIVTPGAETPVAGVVVDNQGEPAYLGYRGSLTLSRLHPDWVAPIESASAVFADGWADHASVSTIILEGLKRARQAGVSTYFDPGPGNPEFDLEWHRQATGLANVLLATEAEASRITRLPDPLGSAKSLLSEGPELVIIKRGVAGCLLLTSESIEIAPGLPVEARDATGAGDSLAAAVIYGTLNRLSLSELGALANATGAAKVLKLGTGHNVPTRDEIHTMLERFDFDADRILGSRPAP